MRKSIMLVVAVVALLAPPALGGAPTAGAGVPTPVKVEEGLAVQADAQPVRLIAVVSSPERGQSVAASVRGKGATDVQALDPLPYVLLTGTGTTVRALAANRDVVQVSADKADPVTLNSSLPVIHADVTRGLGLTGAGVTVAVLDTGIDADHPFFRDNNGGNPGTSRILSMACFSDPNNSGADQESSLCPNGTTTDLANSNADGLPNCLNGAAQLCDHGTHVAGIAAGDGQGVPGAPTAGVAPDAGIVAIQVFTRFDNAGTCGGVAPCVLSYASNQIQGLNRVAALAAANPGWNIRAVNMSIGGGQFSANCDGDPRKPAIDALAAAGIATVIAAGNNAFLNSVSAPGCISTAVTVGSTTDADAVSGFSNRGPLLEVFAPGSSIDSSIVNGWANFNGTSMATPHVVGAFAVLSQAHPARSTAQLRADLIATGVPITYSTGGGTATTPRIDLLAAVNAAGGAANCATVPPTPPPGAIVAVPGVITVGTAGDDVIYGTNGDDRIAGMGGNDLIVGLAGSDQISGGDGDDTICGGDGRDFLTGGAGNDTISGDAGNDDISGDDGDDTLMGGTGIDRISGGAGTDVCNGGGDPGDATVGCP